jgi:hypothetical protein
MGNAGGSSSVGRASVERAIRGVGAGWPPPGVREPLTQRQGHELVQWFRNG